MSLCRSVFWSVRRTEGLGWWPARLRPGVALSLPGHAPLPRPAMDERPGVIEIDLTDGTRLRVDAFVNERALRRVLAVLRTAS